MLKRYRIRTVIGYIAESLRYADTMEEAIRKADEQDEKYDGQVTIEDREEENRMTQARRLASGVSEFTGEEWTRRGLDLQREVQRRR